MKIATISLLCVMFSLTACEDFRRQIAQFKPASEPERIIPYEVKPESKRLGSYPIRTQNITQAQIEKYHALMISSENEFNTPRPNAYCYVTLGRPDCYKQPRVDQKYRLIH